MNDTIRTDATPGGAPAGAPAARARLAGLAVMALGLLLAACGGPLVQADPTLVTAKLSANVPAGVQAEGDELAPQGFP